MLNAATVVRSLRRPHPERDSEMQEIVSGIRMRKGLEMEQV